MQKRKLIIGLLILVLGVGAWIAFRPERLFINAKVNESFPSGMAASTGSSSRLLLAGQFHDGAHKGVGEASIYQLQEGKRVLRFTGFETSNGPDVQVYLVAAADARDSETVKTAGFLPIGALKGNIGDQNYEVPADADLNKYRAVTIWCRRFGVNFATAPLSPAQGNMVAASATPATQALFSGHFHDVAHKGAGEATVYQLADGNRVLRFTNFETSNGPDVQVYLVATSDARDSDTVKAAGFIQVGALKGNIGDQNYELPANVDLSKYRAVTIWCRRFGVNFATAPLSPTQGS
ncbi:MAG: DM13 domain-containing protein [Acidobacteriia bacterium]|nr:DM13 domain-containing protein [Terriglobia bacterium]